MNRDTVQCRGLDPVCRRIPNAPVGFAVRVARPKIDDALARLREQPNRALTKINDVRIGFQYQPEIECDAAVQLHAWAVRNQPPGAARTPAAHRLTMSNRLLTRRFHLLSVTLLESIVRDFAVPDNWP